MKAIEFSGHAWWNWWNWKNLPALIGPASVCTQLHLHDRLCVLEGTIAARYPLIRAEWSGVVDAVGSEGDQAWIGRRVIADNELTCLVCVYCRKGEWRRCLRYRQIGFQESGGYAEYLLVPVRNLYEIPDSVSFEQAALLEPLSVALAVAAIAQPRLHPRR